MATYQVTRHFELTVEITGVDTVTEALVQSKLIDVRVTGEEPDNITVCEFSDDGRPDAWEVEN